MFLIKNIVFSISLGIWLLWMSLFFSYRDVPNNVVCYDNSLKELSDFIIAEGGFPIKAFKYPGCYAGGGWPPIESWFPFFLNFLFWLAVAFFISFIFSI